MTLVTSQDTELEKLNFESPVEVKFANQYKSQAKCKECRVYVEVPNVWEEGAGEDAREHFGWHRTFDNLLSGAL